MSDNQKTARALYEDLNRNDISSALKLFDPQIERRERIALPAESKFHGLQEMEAHIKSGRDTWAEGSCTPEKFEERNDKMLVHVYVKVRLKNQTDWLEGRITDTFRFKDGKIVEFNTFSDKQEAIEWFYNG